MKVLSKKTTTVSLFLLLAMAISLVALPVANSQEPGSKVTHSYIGAIPNPIGVGQETLIHVGMSDPNPLGEGYGWEGLTVTVTRPDGHTETLGPFKTDPTGGTGTVYVPTMVGNYTLQTHCPEQVMPPGNRWTPAGTILLASDSEKLTLIVQEAPLPYYPSSPLPTEYWIRPIDAQLREWNVIAGNWPTTPNNQYAPYNDDAPEAGHVLWTKPIERMGGLVGGEFGPHGYDMGDAYEGKFASGTKSSVILSGVLYYNRFAATGPPAQGIVAVDMRTGEELWFKNNTRFNFGQIFYWDSFNLHGAYAYLWVIHGSTWDALDAGTGEWIYSMTNVPSLGDANIGRQTPTGQVIFGSVGEMYRYTVDLDNGWMTLWNSSKVGTAEGYRLGGFSFGSWGGTVHGKTLDARTGIEWNVSIPTGLQGKVRAVLDDRLIGMTRNRLGEPIDGPADAPIKFWGISTKAGQEGTLLFNTNWQQPPGNLTIDFSAASFEDGVFIMTAKETRAHYGFSIDTGNLMWGPTHSQQYLGLFDLLTVPDYPLYALADGKFFSAGYGGIVYCYDVTTGELLWSYAASDPYNEILWSNNWPILIAFVTDGKVYVAHYEHSPIDPLPRGAPFTCIDAETGEEIWTMNLRANQWGGQPIIGDSVIAILDSYDNRIYAIGKGPSATTVSVQNDVSTLGSSVLVKGMVTDVSPGTNSAGLEMRFPNGVPAVSDANMSDWMRYVYSQFERPADMVGVEVVVSVVDPNNNIYEVGRTTSDADGYFKLMFTPEVPGEYSVIASFDGSSAYYGSFAKTAIGVNEAPAATPEPTPMPASAADLYFLPLSIGMIVAIVIVLALLVLILRRR